MKCKKTLIRGANKGGHYFNLFNRIRHLNQTGGQFNLQRIDTKVWSFINGLGDNSYCKMCCLVWVVFCVDFSKYIQ